MNLDVGTDRFRQRVFAAGAVAVSLLACSRAFGWVFDEHTELGSKGYRDACADLARDLHLDVQPKPAPAGAPAAPDPCVRPKDDTTAAGASPAATSAGAVRTVRRDRRRSRRHARGADVVERPGRRDERRNYTLLALVNVQHFIPTRPGAGGPSTTRRWSSRQGFPERAVARDFAQVFSTSAFADHFLQDAFAAGHAGFNRPASGAVASKGVSRHLEPGRPAS